MVQYHVDAFVPKAPGCGKSEAGWDPERCKQYADFLNHYAKEGWRLHSSDLREVKSQGGCGPVSASWLVCTFERQV